MLTARRIARTSIGNRRQKETVFEKKFSVFLFARAAEEMFRVKKKFGKQQTNEGVCGAGWLKSKMSKQIAHDR